MVLIYLLFHYSDAVVVDSLLLALRAPGIFAVNAVAPSPGVACWEHQARAVVFMCICRPTLTIEKYYGYHDDTGVCSPWSLCFPVGVVVDGYYGTKGTVAQPGATHAQVSTE